PFRRSASRPASASLNGNKKNDVAIVFFTSGTTGLPKKFVLTRTALEYRIANQRITADATDKKALVIPGIGNSFGFYQVLELLNAGKTACVAPSVESMLSLISIFDVDFLVGSPQQVLALTELTERDPGHPTDSLRTIRVGGAM